MTIFDFKIGDLAAEIAGGDKDKIIGLPVAQDIAGVRRVEEAEPCQPLERLAHGLAGHAHPPRDIGLRDPGPRPQPEGEDALLECVEHLVGDAGERGLPDPRKGQVVVGLC